MRQWIQPGSIAFSSMVCLIFGVWMVPEAEAVQGQLPRAGYYNNYARTAPYYLADYDDAFKNFKRGYGAAYRFGTRRHLDSICYLTMMGECNFHMGEYAQAVDFYEQALNLYLSYQAEGWQARVTVPPIISANDNAFVNARVTWGVPRKRSSVARLPSSFSMLFGNLQSEQTLQTGGVVQNAEIYQVDVVEVMRCTALCLHRRRTIKGPITKYDPLTDRLVSGLSVGGVGNGTVMGAFNGVLLGIAYSSMEEYGKAAETLVASMQIKGLDHALKPVALVELAQIAAITENYTEATVLAMEASYSAATFAQFDLVEEALGVGTSAHLMTSRTPFQPLENAIGWAKIKDARMMQASLTVKLAECYAEAGDARTARTVLRSIGNAISSRNSLGNAVVSARLKYVLALAEFLEGDFRGGMSGLSAALKHFQKGSRWLYQLSLTNQLVANQAITERQAELLYAALLRDPTEKDWKTDPMETIAYLVSPHVGAMEVWFDIVVSRLNHQDALEIADLVRRHRFFSSLPLGGRLMAFRWIIHAPTESISQTALAQRTNFLNTNAVYKSLYDRANLIRTELLTLPIKPDPQSPEGRQQLALLEELATISNQQEANLASLALRREPAEMAFPPQLKMSEFQEMLKPEQLAMVSLVTARGYHTFLMNSKSIEYKGMNDGRQVLRSVAGLLKDTGLMEPALDVKALSDESWKKTAREFKENLFGEGSDVNWAKFKELIVVPDGVLWYVPFEILPVGEGDEEKYLSELVDIRYSPTLFLAIGSQRPARPVERSAVVTARMNQRGEAELSNLEFAKLVQNLPDAIQFDTPIRVPSNYFASLFDQLVVWSEIRPTKSGPLAMTPMQIDLGNEGTTLQSWMSLPWDGPEHVVMPGFQSDGGAGMRGNKNGTDLFLTSIGLMASGSRTALISRWATGGKTALELTGQYATNLNADGSVKAVREAREFTRELDVDFENEPRIRFKKTDPAIKAEHPFFWASHMLFAIPDNRKPEEAAADVDEEAQADALEMPAGGQPLDVDPNMDADGAAKMKAAEAQATDGTKQSDPQVNKTSTPETDPKTEKKKELTKEPDKKPVVTFGSGSKPGKGN